MKRSMTALLALLLAGAIITPALAQPFPYESTGLRGPTGDRYGVPHTDGQVCWAYRH